MPSTRPHANGYNLLRRPFKPNEEVRVSRAADLLLAEVANYGSVHEAMKNGAHLITGGAYKKLNSNTTTKVES